MLIKHKQLNLTKGDLCFVHQLSAALLVPKWNVSWENDHTGHIKKN